MTILCFQSYPQIREDAEHGTAVIGARSVSVADAAAVMACLHQGVFTTAMQLCQHVHAHIHHTFMHVLGVALSQCIHAVLSCSVLT